MVKALAAEKAAEAAGYKDENLNKAAKAEILAWRDAKNKASKAAGKTKVHGFNQIPWLIGLCLVFIVLFGVGWTVMGGLPRGKFISRDSFLYSLLPLLAYLASANRPP